MLVFRFDRAAPVSVVLFHSTPGFKDRGNISLNSMAGFGFEFFLTWGLYNELFCIWNTASVKRACSNSGLGSEQLFLEKQKPFLDFWKALMRQGGRAHMAERPEKMLIVWMLATWMCATRITVDINHSDLYRFFITHHDNIMKDRLHVFQRLQLLLLNLLRDSNEIKLYLYSAFRAKMEYGVLNNAQQIQWKKR